MTTTEPAGSGPSTPTPYRISEGADRFGRRWQAEDETGQHRFARRAYTPDGAVRLMSRDMSVYERTGRKSVFQRRRLWWVLTRCRIGWHRWYDSVREDRRFCLTCGHPQPSGRAGETRRIPAHPSTAKQLAAIKVLSDPDARAGQA